MTKKGGKRRQNSLWLLNVNLFLTAWYSEMLTAPLGLPVYLLLYIIYIVNLCIFLIFSEHLSIIKFQSYPDEQRKHISLKLAMPSMSHLKDLQHVVLSITDIRVFEWHFNRL